MTATTSAQVEADSRRDSARERRSATRFFWFWLIVATAMSVSGNVAHAVVHARADTLVLAAGAALVPPVVLLAATHSVALLVRTHAGGVVYWFALVMTVALAVCAFVLSFDALRSLAVSLGLPAPIAWLWPCAIDTAIAQATLCLLSLSRGGADTSPSTTTSTRPDVAAANMSRRRGPLAVNDDSTTATPKRVASVGRHAVAPAAVGDESPAAIGRWKTVAQSLVQQGVTSKDPTLVATILAQHEAGMPPSTIGRTFNVHHTTVGRILSAIEGDVS